MVERARENDREKKKDAEKGYTNKDRENGKESRKIK